MALPLVDKAQDIRSDLSTMKNEVAAYRSEQESLMNQMLPYDLDYEDVADALDGDFEDVAVGVTARELEVSEKTVEMSLDIANGIAKCMAIDGLFTDSVTYLKARSDELLNTFGKGEFFNSLQAKIKEIRDYTAPLRDKIRSWYNTGRAYVKDAMAAAEVYLAKAYQYLEGVKDLYDQGIKLLVDTAITHLRSACGANTSLADDVLEITNPHFKTSRDAVQDVLDLGDDNLDVLAEARSRASSAMGLDVKATNLINLGGTLNLPI